jgi:hypothetical protein
MDGPRAASGRKPLSHSRARPGPRIGGVAHANVAHKEGTFAKAQLALSRTRDHCRPSTRSGQPAGCERPRRRRARRIDDSAQRARSAGLQIRPRFRRLAWRDAQTQLDRRQGEIRVDNQARQSVYPSASGVGRHLGLAGGAKAQGRVVRLAGRAQSAQTGQGRGRGGLANKLARIVWAIITTGEAFRTSIYAKA